MGIRRHLRYSEVRTRNSIKGWGDQLKGVPAFVLGNSPALNDEDLSSLEPFVTIGLNRAFYKIDPTILLWQDIELWFTERKKILRLNAIKVCRDTADPQNRFFHYRLRPGNFKLPESPNNLHGFGTTGPIGVQLAYALGCNPIVILGMDCVCRGHSTDFYGRNRHHKPHTLTNCRKGLKWIKKEVAPKREIINCSADNEYFKYTPLEEVVAQFTPKYAQNRGVWASKLV